MWKLRTAIEVDLAWCTVGVGPMPSWEGYLCLGWCQFNTRACLYVHLCSVSSYCLGMSWLPSTSSCLYVQMNYGCVGWTRISSMVVERQGLRDLRISVDSLDTVFKRFGFTGCWLPLSPELSKKRSGVLLLCELVLIGQMTASYFLADICLSLHIFCEHGDPQITIRKTAFL